MTDTLHADMVMLMVVALDQGWAQQADALAFTNIAPDAMAEYGQDFAAHDPWMHFGTQRLATLQALRLDSIVAAESFRAHAALPAFRQ